MQWKKAKEPEACRLAGISKNTFLRWIQEGQLADTEYRDRRGWRFFGEDELNTLGAEVNRIQIKWKIPQCGLPQLGTKEVNHSQTYTK